MKKKKTIRPNSCEVGTDIPVASAEIMNRADQPKLRLENINYYYGKGTPFEDEHGTAHAVAFVLSERERSCEGHTVHMADAGGTGTGIPSADSLPCVTEAAFLVAGEQLGV